MTSGVGRHINYTRGLVMGDEISRPYKKGFESLKKIPKKIEKPVRTGASATQRDAAKTLAEQQQKESALLAEKEGEIALKKAGATKGGRQSLIKSSAGGLANNLGGTA